MSSLQQHEPDHGDDHEEPGQDTDADEDDVAGVLAPGLAGVRPSCLLLLGLHQVFGLAQPVRAGASDEGDRGLLPLRLALHLVPVDILLVACREVDVERADDDVGVVPSLQDKG